MRKIGKFMQPLQKPLANVRGVTGFVDWKFYLIFVLYIASFLVLVRDPFFRLRGEVVFQQGMITLLLAVILLNTAYWDLQLFGKPSGANLLLQVLSYLPGGILIARLFGKATQPENVTVTKELWSELTAVTNKIVALPSLPSWLTDMICNWKITIAFVLLLIILSLNLRKQIKIGAIFLFLLIPFLNVIAENTDIAFVATGTFLMVTGLCIQFCRYDNVVYFEQIDASLRQSSEIDSLLLRSIMRIMTRMYQDSKLSESDVKEIVAEEYNAARGYGNGYDDMEINQIAIEVTRKMIHSFNLISIQQSSNGALVYPNRRLFIYDSMLRGIAIWPRALAVLFFAIIWSISPIDIIPDALPLIGTVDDVFVGIATTLMLSNTIQQEKRS